MNVSEKIYAFLLCAYPHEYRTRYALPMEQLFRDRLRDARSFTQRMELWARVLADWVTSVPARHLERAHPHGFTGWQPGARRCLFFARCEASSFSRREITLEHLLLGILRQEQSLVSQDASQAIVRAIEASEPAGRRIPPPEDLRLSLAAMRAVVAAASIARKAGRRSVTPADLAAGILREADTLAARLLREHISPHI